MIFAEECFFKGRFALIRWLRARSNAGGRLICALGAYLARQRTIVSESIRIAVIGSGITGLSVAWLLSQRFRVTLFEAQDYLGGHTNTVDVTLDGVCAPVDTGFLVFNERTYPNLVALFGQLGVRTASSEMSFSVRVDGEQLEWAGNSLASVFAQKRNLGKPEFWRMLKDILRFNREVTKSIATKRTERLSLGAYLQKEGYGRAFRDWYLLPMSGAIWSCPTRQMLEYPAETFFRFCHNHGLLQLTGRPSWKTVAGGGREYVRRLAVSIEDIRLACPVASVSRNAAGVIISPAGGAPESFSQVVFACHSDQTLALLDDAAEAEKSVLSRISYQPNHAVLHTDRSFLPRNRDAWSAWNYIGGEGGPDARPVSVSYLINKLQPLPFAEPVIVTLNPARAPRADSIIKQFDYAHPVFDQGAIDAQRELPLIQGRRNTWYCGAWTGHGFHEDGLKSALSVANALDVQAPWQPLEMAA
jgi:predicted NAD/FAD-binding protein